MSQPPFELPPPPKTPILVRLLRLAILTLIGMSSLLLLLGLALAGFQWAIQDRIVPGLRVADIDIGGLTAAEAVAALAQQYESVEDLHYTLSDGERSWTATAAELGLSFPADELVERAFAIGHATSDSLRQQAQAWFNGEQLDLTLHFDESLAFAYLQRLATEIDRDQVDASLQIDGIDVNIIPGIGGRKLDLAASLEALRAAILAQDGSREIPLVIHESKAQEWNLPEAAARLRTALSAPLQLVGTDTDRQLLAPWILTPQQILAGLEVTLHTVGDQKLYEVNIDLSAYQPFLASLSPALSLPAIDGRFDFDPQTGALNAISPSARGRRLDAAETIRRLEGTVFEPEARSVSMVFESLPPRFHEELTAAELGITELVAQATTYFWGSWQNRRTNIAIGAGKLHGIIIAPGEEFSFNQYLGEITPAAGYLEGSVILGGATVTGIGGGICQVSTTMFRAAFSGGYAITERNSHGYRVGYYEYAGAGPGLDAAIWQPDIDLRFQNNTPHHLLIESDFLPAQDAIQFRFYSTRHWHTEVEQPIIRDIVPAPEAGFVEASDLAQGQIRQIDYAADGADVWVYRNIYSLDGSLIKRDQAYTHYSPWQAIFEVAPGDPRLPQEEDEEEETTEGSSN